MFISILLLLIGIAVLIYSCVLMENNWSFGTVFLILSALIICLAAFIFGTILIATTILSHATNTYIAKNSAIKKCSELGGVFLLEKC